MGDDNRIRLDQTPVDFTPVEMTGGLNDKYPAPNTQSRYDQMRSYLIGLLSNQSSPAEPFEKRTGTLWYQRAGSGANNPEFFSVHVGVEDDGTGGRWDSLADHIAITINDTTFTLTEILNNFAATLQYAAPRVVWSGQVSIDNTSNTIPIPASFAGFAAMPNMAAMVYVNGLLLDPRISKIITGEVAYIQLTDAFTLKFGQKFTVILEYITQLEQATIIA